MEAMDMEVVEELQHQAVVEDLSMRHRFPQDFIMVQSVVPMEKLMKITKLSVMPQRK